MGAQSFRRAALDRYPRMPGISLPDVLEVVAVNHGGKPILALRLSPIPVAAVRALPRCAGAGHGWQGYSPAAPSRTRLPFQLVPPACGARRA